VPAVLPIWEKCAEVLRSIGYTVATGNLASEQYGVPQTRKRAILVARAPWMTAAMGPAELPEPTHSRYHPRTPTKLDDGVLPWVSMAEALGWGLTARTSPTVTGGGTETGGAEPIAKLVDRWTTRPDWCYRRPATTVVATFYPDVIAAPGYRTEVSRQDAPDSVRITVAEAGVLQSFPGDYPWQGAKGKQYLQAGNAIPPLLAMAALCAALGEPYVPPVALGERPEQAALDLADLCASPSGVTGPVHRPLTHPAATVTGADNFYVRPTSQCHKRLAD